MNKTLNNITDKIEELAEAHEMINDYSGGNTANMGTDVEEARDLKYPYLWWDYRDTGYLLTQNTRGIAEKVYAISVCIMDKMTPNINNTSEVMSDTEFILSNIVQKIANDKDLREFRLDYNNIQVLPVSDDEIDGAMGWCAVLNFKIPYDFCATQLPM